MTSFVVVSTFTVANGMIAEVKEAFRKRPGRVELSQLVARYWTELHR